MRKAADAGAGDFRGAKSAAAVAATAPETYLPEELEIIKMLSDYPATVQAAGENYSPSLIAAYAYDLAKLYNSYYHDHSILREQNAAVRAFRLRLSEQVAATIKKAMHLLGITVPERM